MDKFFKASIFPKSLSLTILVSAHNLQGHKGKKTYSIMKGDFLCNRMHQDIDKFIQNCHACRQHSLQKQSYSYIQMRLHQRLPNLIACDKLAPFTKAQRKTNMYSCACDFSQIVQSNTYTQQNSCDSCLSLTTACVYHISWFSCHHN